MFKRFALCVVVLILVLFGAASDSLAQAPPAVPPGEVFYVSTGFVSHGGQILQVDANSGTVTVVPINNVPSCDDTTCFGPEGIVVGPDSKIYMADPTDGFIYRLPQSGGNLETVLTANCDGAPCTPQGPVFSGSGAGDLYFSDPPKGDFSSTNSLFEIPGAGAVPTGGTFSSPVTKISPSEVTYSVLGQGTGFDANDNLLFNDNTDVDVFSLAPPSYTTLSGPFTGPKGAIALNSLTGLVYVADPNTGNIAQLGSEGPAYYSFNTDETGNIPGYMAFDATGHLFVVTTSPSDPGYFGMVWRIDPAGSAPNCTDSSTPCATLLANLNSLYTSEGSPLTSDNAVGVAVPETQGLTQFATITTTTAVVNFGWPLGCNAAFSSSNTCLYTWGVTAPEPGTFPTCSTVNPCTISAFPTYTTEAQWVARTCTAPNTTFCGTKLAPVAGLNASGIVYTAMCTQNGSSCPVPTNYQDFSYTSSTTWKSSQPHYCALGPGYLRADIGQDNWINTWLLCSTLEPEPTYGNGGGAHCTSTSCLSDWGSVSGISGPIPELSSTSINFGLVPLYHFPVQTLTLTNIGSTSLSISNIAITPVPGGDSDDFLWLPLCPRTLAVGKSCTVILGFFADADDFNPQSATLNIYTNAAASPQSVVLTAQVVP
jgi:hypothetical protein